MTTTTEVKKQPLYRNSYVTELDEPDDELVIQANPDADPEENANSNANQNTDPVDPEEKFFKNRYDSLKAHHDKTIRELRDTVEGLRSELTKKSSQEFDLPASQEDLDQWRKNYPDLYRVVKMISRLEATETTKNLQSKIERVEKDAAKVEQEKAQALLLRLHTDFPELRVDPNFHAWLEAQDPVVQSWLYEGTNAHLAAKAITMYKAERLMEEKKGRRRTSADASLAVTGTRSGSAEVKEPKRWKMSEIQKLTPAQYEKYETEIDKAIAEGRIDY